MSALTPLGILKRGTRTALRRRYGYAALRVMRATLQRALHVHRERQLDPSQAYSVQTQEVREAYFAAMRKLKRRWPHLNFLDQRSNTNAGT